MSEKIVIGLDLDNGLHVDSEDKVGVYYEQNGNMHLETDPDPTDGKNGIYVENLNGADGSGGASRYDGWTMKPGTGWNLNDSSQTISNFIDMDRDVVNLIFTFGLYKVTTRHPTSISYSSAVKDVRAICNEIVAPVYYSPSSYTSFKPGAGELIQLVKNPTFRTVPYTGGTGSTIAVESGNRIGNDNLETAVMFVIMDITYSPNNIYWVTSMNLCCIYSTVPDFVVGQSYSGTQLFQPPGYV